MGRRDGDFRRLSSYAPACFTLLALMLDAPTIHAHAPDWSSAYWSVVPSSGGAEKRSAPIRTIVRDAGGRLLGTRPTGSAIELWGSDNNGVDWSRMRNVASNSGVTYGDSTLVALAN